MEHLRIPLKTREETWGKLNTRENVTKEEKEDREKGRKKIAGSRRKIEKKWVGRDKKARTREEGKEKYKKKVDTKRGQTRRAEQKQ